MTRVFSATSQAMMTVVRWLLAATPVGVFALTFIIALRPGTSCASPLGAYHLLRIGVTLLCVALLYPISVVLGRTTARACARAVFPAQVVAVSERPSLAGTAGVDAA